MKDLRRRIGRAAERFDHHRLGSEHLVLALLDPADSSRGAMALRQCAISETGYADVVAALARDSTVRPARSGVLEYSRELIAIFAKAEGLAMATGSAATLAEHLLMAMLWHHRQPCLGIQLLQKDCEVTRRQIVEELVALGAETPKVELPPDLLWTEPRRVSRSEFKEVQADLARRGIRYGCKAQGDDILVFTAQAAARQ
jgi:ATP-dependent Clp protease ATP-binding subunit ClpA